MSYLLKMEYNIETELKVCKYSQNGKDQGGLHILLIVKSRNKYKI